MPGRQAIIYDKRAEVIAHQKMEWPRIWARALGCVEGSRLDISDQTKSQIWRVEIRVAKKHLKDVWHVKGWASFYEQLPKIFRQLLQDIRYCEPTDDKNRARWPLHPIWRTVEEVVETKLFVEVPRLCTEEYKEVMAKEKSGALIMQAASLIISAGAIDGIRESKLPNYAQASFERVCKDLKLTERPVAKRLFEACQRFSYLV